MKKFAHQTDSISQGLYVLIFLLHIHQTCLLHSILTKAEPVGLTTDPMLRSNDSANHRVGGQQILGEGLNLTANHSLCPAFDVCSENTKLINAVQRQKHDILVSLRGFVTGQCSVMMILKIDRTECM